MDATTAVLLTILVVGGAIALAACACAHRHTWRIACKKRGVLHSVVLCRWPARTEGWAILEHCECGARRARFEEVDGSSEELSLHFFDEPMEAGIKDVSEVYQ